MSARRYKNKLIEMMVLGLILLLFGIVSFIIILVLNINLIFVLISAVLAVLGITFTALGYKSIKGFKRRY